MTMDDWDLLRDYCRGSETAFAELVRRHLNAVYSTALRRVGHPETARDVCQRVFTLLSRKASSLPRSGSLLGWLHRAAVHVSSDILRSERRRQSREQEACYLNSMSPDPGSDDVWHQVAPQLDTALLDLPEVDRQALLLRFFERLPLAEVGRRLGTSEAAAKMRVGRAVTKLRERLGGRGVVLTGALLVGLLSERTVVAAPAGFADGVLTATLSKSGPGVSPFETALSNLPRLALPLAGLATAVVLGTLGVMAWRPTSRPDTTPNPASVAAAIVPSSGTPLRTAEPPTDPLDHPANLDQAIARLRDIIRTPFNRQSTEAQLIAMAHLNEAVQALGRHASKALPMVLEELAAAVDLPMSHSFAEFQQKSQIRTLAVVALSSMGPAAHEAVPQLMEWYREAKLDGHSDTIPMLLVELEPTADQSWDLITHIARHSDPESSFVPEIMRQLTELHPELLPGTLQLLADRLSQSTGDYSLMFAQTLAKLPGSDPDQIRPILERFLLLPELRDPLQYQPVIRNGITDLSRVTETGRDDVRRFSAVAALASMGDSARDSLPALAELAQRTSNGHLREQVYRSIAALDPERRFETPDLAVARKVWEQDEAFFHKVKSGTAELEDLRQGLTRPGSADTAASILAQRANEDRAMAPELVNALTRTGSHEVAQVLKNLAPEHLVDCLKNPAAFTRKETYEFKPRTERDALVEAAQALAELGPNAAFALPALREALDIPDQTGVRLTLDETIRAIDPQAPRSVFIGGSTGALKLALVNARIEAESSGDAERARLADATAGRIELKYGMTWKELLTIDAELHAADPALHALYRQALVGAIPELQSPGSVHLDP